MSTNEKKAKKVPLWVWIVGGFLVLGALGNLVNDETPQSAQESIEEIEALVEPAEPEIVEEVVEPAEEEIVEEVVEPAEPEVVEEIAEPSPEQTAPAEETAAEDIDPRFSSCTKAIEAGYGPYTSGVDEEYSWYQDRDNDGVVCER